jgi:hypothetical protein
MQIGGSASTKAHAAAADPLPNLKRKKCYVTKPTRKVILRVG